MTTNSSDTTSGLDPRRWRTLRLLGIAQLMLIVDITVVAVALPDLGRDLTLSREALTWVVSAYTLVFGGLMLLGGKAADLLGSRKVVLTGLTVFTIASLVTGLAPTAEVLIASRMAQGAGAALLSPAALSVIVRTFEGAELNRALGFWSALGGAGAAIGVLLGGVLTSAFGWAWVFYVNVPVGVALVLALLRTLPRDVSGGSVRRLDVVSAVLVTLATGSVIYALVNAGDRGWLSLATALPVVVGVLLYVAFGLRQRASADPLLNLGLLRRRTVMTGLLLIGVATALMISVFFLGTFYLQHTEGFGPLATGLLFLPVAGATVLGAQLGGRIIGRLGPRVLGSTALLVAAAGLAVPSLWSGTTAMVTGVSAGAVGIGAVFVVASTTTFAQVDFHEAGVASGLLSTCHELGAAIGVSAVSSIAAAGLVGSNAARLADGFTFASIVALAAAVLVVALVTPVRSADHATA
ncbi:MFS transporter [Nocardioides sp.]|uniref:MFS transporter n=1 Tax=Nocardioides sp. TaxID=35761 RepID=UPI002ED33C50